MTWRKAIDKVLGSSPTPLHYNEITQRIIEEGLRQKLGATPAATVNAQIAVSIKREGAKSPYIRVSNETSWGRVALRTTTLYLSDAPAQRAEIP
ncbi:MAG TPA: hypothetical protein ENN65_06410 [Candidatus Hydrogenedentes bacterium]|nr:hypothetical protein [Candidatus Hydrogenedentota bacterium]